MSGSLHDVIAAGFRTQSQVGADALAVKLVGNADMDVHEAVSTFMIDLHDLALRNRVATVVVDIRDLYFMNSYCLRHFVSWLTSVADLSAEDRYRVRFVTNPNLGWQKRSLSSLRHLAADAVEVC